MPQTTEPKKVNHLNRVHQRKLEDWLNRNWKQVNDRKLTPEKVAVGASKALGFKASVINVKSAAKTMELKWPKQPRRPSKKAPPALRFRPVVVEMVGICTQLCEKFDMPVPEHFETFLKGTAKYRYERVLVCIAEILSELAPLADIEFPKELQDLLKKMEQIEQEE